MSVMKKWLAIIGVLMGNMAMGLSFSLINTNLDAVGVALGASMNELQWIINIYGIFIAATLVTMGRFGDIFGRKKVYLIGTSLFGISMLGAGLATNATIIIGFQALYGIAGAILLPLSQAMLVDLYPEDKKSTAIGLWASSGGITLALGPIVGGLLLNWLSWRWVFLVNVPFAILSVILTALFAKESKTQGVSTKIDWPGVTLLTLTIGIFILATVQIKDWNSGLITGLFIASIICFIALLKVEKKVEMPIIRNELFKNRMFVLCCVGNFCLIAFFWSAIFLIPLYIQRVLGYDSLRAGLIMLAFSLPICLFSPVAGYFYEKIGPRILIFAGFALMALSAVLQMQFGPQSSPFYVVMATACLGFGISLIVTPSTTGALATISKNFAGVASGTFITIQEIGGSVGLAVTVTVVRMQSEFSKGFQNGMLVLVLVSLIGVVSAIFIPKKSTQTEPVQTID